MKFIYLIILIIFSQKIIGQEHLSDQKNTVVTSIPFKLTDHNNISIPVLFGSVDSLNLMLHTAVNTVMLTKEAVQNIESIHWDDQSTVGSWGGKAASRYSLNNTIEVGGLKRDSLTIWEDERSGPNTDGKFGLNLFNGYIIEIDFELNLITLHKALPNNSKEYTKMKLISQNGNLFMLGKSKINGLDYENKFLIHSGYGGALLFDDEFVLKSQIGEQIEITEESQLKDSFGNVIEVKKGLLPFFSLGGIELAEVPVGFFQGKIGKQQMSIIGGDLLKRFNMIIDLEREFIYLKTNEMIETAFTKF